MAHPLIGIEQVTTSVAAGGTRRQVLRAATLHVARGDVCGIVGASGAGKSTLLRTVNLLDVPDSGAVVVAGRDLARLARRDLRATPLGRELAFYGTEAGVLFHQGVLHA